jgi:hypothetical protein
MAWLAVTLLVFARFLPGEHVTMFSALDDGWAQGINLAVQRGMVFGRDIIFTYGPFGPVETRLYDPALRPMVIAGASILTLGFATGLQALARPAMAVLVALVLPLVANDALAYAVPLPALLLCARAPQNARLPHGTRRAVLALLPALALLPLAKGSLLIAACLATALLAAMLWRQGSRTLAAGVPAAVLACLLLLWPGISRTKSRSSPAITAPWPPPGRYRTWPRPPWPEPPCLVWCCGRIAAPRAPPACSWPAASPCFCSSSSRPASSGRTISTSRSPSPPWR